MVMQFVVLLIVQDLILIILLVLDMVKVDLCYVGGVSIGGGVLFENLYYIDGFLVINVLLQLGFIELFFGVILQVNVLIGGFGVEFGCLIGGVMNIVIKSGGNKWEGGVFVFVELSVLCFKYYNNYFVNIGVIDSNIGKFFDGMLQFYNEKNIKSEYKYGVYVGGLIVQDKFFLFVVVDQMKEKDEGINLVQFYMLFMLFLNGWLKDIMINNCWLVKFDWQIIDDYCFLVMNFGDNYIIDVKYYGFDYLMLQYGLDVKYMGYYVNQFNILFVVGGQVSLICYMGNLIDNLVVMVLYG